MIELWITFIANYFGFFLSLYAKGLIPNFCPYFEVSFIFTKFTISIILNLFEIYFRFVYKAKYFS
jgi:hypothetical protein